MHEFVDETFDLGSTREKILSIQVSLNGFSFSIICPNNNKLVYFKNNSLKISTEDLLYRHFESWFEEEDLLKKDYNTIRIFYHSNNTTLIPNQFFNPRLKDKLTPLLFADTDKLSWQHNSIDSVSGKIMFSVPETLLATIKKLLPTACVVHPLKTLINNVNNTEIEQTGILLFESNFFTLILENCKTLQFVNSFSFKHPNDVIYFVLTTLKQFKLSTKSIQILYSGDVETHTDLVGLLGKHFPNADKITTTINVPPHLDETLISKNISLFL